MRNGGFAIVLGTLAEGFKLIGPFPTRSAATAYAVAHCDGLVEIFDLELPRGDEETSGN